MGPTKRTKNKFLCETSDRCGKEARGGNSYTGMVYMCLPGLWVNLRYFARVMGHVL